MKKIFLSLLLGSSIITLAQETTINDALRYSMNNITGTARFRAMSGAFGAVGGDLSSINVNPAGSLFFNNNFASISASNFNVNNNSNYFGTRTKENLSTLDLNQIGGVMVFEDISGKANWSKISFALNYENTGDFDNSLYSAGVNSTNSISQYFVNQANYIANTDFNDYQYEMAYETYIINEDASTPNLYVSNVPSGGNYFQDNYVTSNGFNGKLSANIATGYKDKLFLGLNLNAHFTDYVLTTSLYESNDNPANSGVQPTVRNIIFDNQLSTYGSGFSLNVGAIYKATESLRLGVAYESPTWYRLNDELSQRLIVNTTDGTNNFQNVVAPNVLNVYETYRIQTPSKVTLSGAYIFNKKGLISIDYAMRDYSNTKFKPTNDNLFRNLNNQMSNQLDNTYELRIGGEYKIKQWSVRGGYRFEESPFKVDYAMGDLTGYSGGLGYNFGESRLDLAYQYDHRNYNLALISSGMNDTARVRTINNNVTLTYSINF